MDYSCYITVFVFNHNKKTFFFLLLLLKDEFKPILKRKGKGSYNVELYCYARLL